MEVLTEEVKRPRLKIKQAEVLEAPRVGDLPIRNNNFVEEKGVEVSLKRLTDIISLKSDSISNFFAPFNPHKDRIFNGWELSLIFGDQYDQTITTYDTTSPKESLSYLYLCEQLGQSEIP